MRVFELTSEPGAAMPPSEFAHLPADAADLLSVWRYKGISPTVVEVGEVMPTVAFSTVDLKLPEEGPTKVLELNGWDSGLWGYGEERSENTIIDRRNELFDSLGIPVVRFRWDRENETYYEITRDKHPFDASNVRDLAARTKMQDEFGDPYAFDTPLQAREEQFLREWLNAQRQGATVGDPATLCEIKDISEATMLIELCDSWQPLFRDFDPSHAIIASPAEFRVIEEDKLAFAAMARRIGLDDYRPRWSAFKGGTPQFSTSGYDIRHDEAVSHVMLKDPKVDSGRGVMELSRKELNVLTEIAERSGTWGAMIKQLAGKGFGSRAEAIVGTIEESRKSLLVEEYTPSKLIETPDGWEYDATMRLVVASLANRGRATIVPLAAYWKLPIASVDDITYDSHRISSIKRGGSMPVAQEDFQRAFNDVAHFMHEVLKHTRTTDPHGNYWNRSTAARPHTAVGKLL